jgi:two-component system phosphate regulon sensor histidine kinase PhoR
VTARWGWLASYRARLVMGFAFVMLVLAGAWAWSLYGPLENAVVEQQEGHLTEMARAWSLALAGSDDDVATVAEDLTAEADLRLTLIGTDGTVLLDSQEDAPAMEDHGDRPEVVEALEDGVGADTRVSATQSVEQLYVAVRTSIRGDEVVLRVSRPLERIEALVGQARGTGLLLLVLALAVSLFAAYRVARSTAEPVHRLASAARSIADGDLGTPIPREEGELAALSESMEHLVAEVRSRFRELEAEQHDLRLVLNGLSDSVFLVEDDVVLLANRAASDLFKEPVSGWHGHPLDDTTLPASLASDLAERMATDESDAWQWGPDPTNRYLSIAVVPLPREGARRVLVVVSDITDRRRLDAIRRDFVTNASHELKTPASSIHLLAESAALATSEGDTEATRRFVGQIGDETARLRQLVSALLDLSRLEMTPEPGSVTDVRDALTRSATAHRVAAESRGLDLEVDLSGIEDQDVYAQADPTDLAVALDNLLDNAVAYTESGSVRLTAMSDEESVSLAVVDTGIGIPAEEQDRVFERFYRVDPARTRATGGTGLGLALVRHAVERSGGTVALESLQGEGTRVTLTMRRKL